MDMSNMKQLRKIAKELNVVGRWDMRKEVLEKAIEEAGRISKKGDISLVEKIINLKNAEEVKELVRKNSRKDISEAAGKLGVRSLFNKSRRFLVVEAMDARKKEKIPGCGHLKKKQGKCTICVRRCVHGSMKDVCMKCRNGKHICIHSRLKYHCKECGGSQVCKHKKKKGLCEKCFIEEAEEKWMRGGWISGDLISFESSDEEVVPVEENSKKVKLV